jgi:hypothetical protein
MPPGGLARLQSDEFEARFSNRFLEGEIDVLSNDGQQVDAIWQE